MAYIYKITNQINNKSYIGKTENVNPNRRWSQHKAEAQKERNSERALYKAINKYGIANFSFEIIEETNEPEKREIYFIALYDTYHNGYNETLGGDGAKYLELPEEEICAYYLNSHTVKEVSKQFGHDPETIRRVLYRHNIDIISSQEITKQRNSKAVAKIDKDTDEIIEIYPSISEAERLNPKCHSHIKDVCRGKRKTTGGYKWKVIEH